MRPGLTEGTSNTHPGQGTACRRFFFRNAYLELLWVSDPAEAQSELARPTRLWERWAQRGHTASPFGIVLRPVEGAPENERPFATWAYHPRYLPPDLAIEIARDTPLGEPGLFYLPFATAREDAGPRAGHGIQTARVTGVTVGLPGPGPRSPAANSIEALGLVRFLAAEEHLMTVTFDDARSDGRADLRPDLPLLLRW